MVKDYALLAGRVLHRSSWRKRPDSCFIAAGDGVV
jgi:hypothetical protein